MLSEVVTEIVLYTTFG